MKKISIIAITALMGLFGYSDVTTNAVDVYDMTVSVKTPVVKLAKSKNRGTYIYRVAEKRTLKGTLTLTWVKEDGDAFETVIPSLVLWDKSTKDKKVDYSIIDSDVAQFEVTPFDASIIGSGMNKSALTFIGVDNSVNGGASGYKFLAFSGFGGVTSVKTTVAVCGACGIMSTTSGYCTKISKVSGGVVGMYSCGCDGDSPSAFAQSCGFIDDGSGATPLVGCYGTWTAKYNKSLSR